MDHATFDRLTRRIGAPATRRAGLGLALGAAGGALASLFLPDEHDVHGKGKNRKRNRRKKQQARRTCPETHTDCGGGACAAPGECCPGEKSCGGGCIRARECCPYTERACPSGGCVAKDACCPIVEERCGAGCCVLGEECCNGTCSVSNGGICTADGWCPPVTGWACCAGSVSDCGHDPCCNVEIGQDGLPIEGCCVIQTEPFIQTTCCPGGPGQCGRGGCCPVGTTWKGDCEACCTEGTTGCSVCQAPVGGRG